VKTVILQGVRKMIHETATRPKTWGGAEPLTLLIYPEGSTTNGQFIGLFKIGAFMPGLPVQPVVIRNRHIFFTPSPIVGTKFFVLRMLAQFVQYMEVEYLPVYVPSEEEKKDPVLYANNVREIMAQALNMGLSDCSVDDVLLDVLADAYGLAPNEGIIEWGYFAVTFNLRMVAARAALSKFHEYKRLLLPAKPSLKVHELDPESRVILALPGLSKTELLAGLNSDGIVCSNIEVFFEPSRRTHERMPFREFLYFLCSKQGPFAELHDKIPEFEADKKQQ